MYIYEVINTRNMSMRTVVHVYMLYYYYFKINVLLYFILYVILRIIINCEKIHLHSSGIVIISPIPSAQNAKTGSKNIF